jgi:hypothetical protein
MSEAQPLSEGSVPSLPPGAAPHDHPGWRLLFRLVDLGCSNDDASGLSPYVRITLWAVVLLVLFGAIIWLAGPWIGLGTGGLYGVTKAGKTIHRRITRKGQDDTAPTTT